MTFKLIFFSSCYDSRYLDQRSLSSGCLPIYGALYSACSRYFYTKAHGLHQQNRSILHHPNVYVSHDQMKHKILRSMAL
jgi:hypothetical protein